MALQLRRGINSQRATTALAPGELVYVTDNLSAQVSPLYIGDGSTPGGVPVVRVVSVNGQSGAVILDSDTITEGTTNKYYLADRAQDDVGAALVAGNAYNTGITFTYGATEDGGNRIKAVVAASGTVNSGTTGKIPYYSAGGTAISPTVNLSWQESVKTLTMGGGTINMDADVSDRSHIVLETSATGVPGNSISFNRARGLTVSKTTIVSGDVLGNVNFSGYDGDQFVTSAIIRGTSNGAVSNNNVPSLLGFFTTDTDGVIRQHVRMLGSGQTIFGPANTTDTGSGSIRIISTSNTGEANNVSALGIQTFFNGQDGQNFSAIRARGTRASSLPVVSGDDILDFNFNGYDGSGYPLTAQITVSVDNTVSVGIVPSALTFSVTNISGARNPVVKINNGTGTSNGLLAVTGTVKASVAIQTAVFADNTARNTTIPVPSVGMIIFNTATGKFEGNTDGTQSGWVALN
jgi:hypothetical protein